MAFVIATAWGTRGDVTPYVAIGAELVKRGHEVALVSNPVFEPQALEAGLSFVPVGTASEYDAFVAEPGLWDRRSHIGTGVAYMLPTVEGFYRAVVETYRPGETVLLASRHGSWIAREKLDIPSVVLRLSPRALSRLDPPHPGRPFPTWTDWIVRRPWGLRQLHAMRARRKRLLTRLGRPALTGSEWTFKTELQRVRALAGLPNHPASEVLPALTICLWPSWFSPPQADWPTDTRTAGFLFHPKPPPSPRATDGDGQSRPIVFTRGSAARGQRAFFEEALRCCQELGSPGVLLTPHAADVPSELPADVRHTPFASLGELFSSARAVVHHGGVGTMAYAFAAGLPQVVVPIVAEQFDLGYRMERLGVGSMLAADRVPSGRLARELSSLCASERVRRRCESLRDQVDPEAGSLRAVDWIEEVISSSLLGRLRA